VFFISIWSGEAVNKCDQSPHFSSELAKWWLVAQVFLGIYKAALPQQKVA
jgi:hypothetical protein